MADVNLAADPMLIFLLTAMTGGAFGLLFRIWILLPASIILVASIIAFGGGSSVALFQSCALAVVCLQGGYGMGAVARFAMAAANGEAMQPVGEKECAGSTSPDRLEAT